jgi:hypothetical protein
MSEEYDNHSETFSPFYPLLILLVGLVGWSGYQVYMANSQRAANSQQIQAAMPTIGQAQNIRDRYVALMKDLIETSAKDANAAQIVKEATNAGLIRQAPASGDSGASTNAAPADSSAPAPAPAPAK